MQNVDPKQGLNIRSVRGKGSIFLRYQVVASWARDRAFMLLTILRDRNGKGGDSLLSAMSGVEKSRASV
jgi:hypothetical protein